MKQLRKAILNDSEKIIKNNRLLSNLTKRGAVLERLAYLPKPHIYNMFCQSEVLEQSLGNAKEKFLTALKEKNLFITEILANLYAQKDIDINNALLNLAKYHQPQVCNVRDISLQTIELIEKSLFQYRFSVCKGAIFEIAEPLSKALIETDITGKCPTTYLRPPFEHIFLHFGVNHEHTLSLEHDDFYLEGAYISYIEVAKHHQFIERINTHLQKNEKSFKNIQYAIEITLSFSKKTKESAKDTQEIRVYLIVDNENENVETCIKNHQETWGIKGFEYPMIFNSILHIAKSLLIINTKNREDIIIQTENGRNTVKRRALKKYTTKKAMCKALEQYDKIIIDTDSPEFISDYTLSHQSISSGKKAHWRRGHFRELPESLPNRPNTRLVWVRPALVGAKLGPITNTEKKGYIAS
jgi:hypothetical protein